MVTSIILMNVERTKINEVAERLADMNGISEVYSVSGYYDLIAIARVHTNEELSELVTKHMLKIKGGKLYFGNRNNARISSIFSS